MKLDATAEWLDYLAYVMEAGHEVSGTKEMLMGVIRYSMAHPVVNLPSRGTNFKFMAAEAAYILGGHNRIDMLCESLPHFKQYSDDGYFQAGAYGPAFIDQLPYIVKTLKQDYASRRAVLSIWRPRPYDTRDYPCTLTLQFIIRGGKLNLIVNMRSSDVFTGLIYDMFCFAMMGLAVCSFIDVEPGLVYIAAGSSHVYDKDRERALATCLETEGWVVGQPWRAEKPHLLEQRLWAISHADRQKEALDALLMGGQA